MKTLVVYDSVHGNTEAIARAIGDGLGGESRVIRARDAGPADLEGLDLLVVGAPTHGGRPTEPVKAFLDGLPDSALKDIRVAAFDTRLTTRWVTLFGYAAGRIADGLKKGGAILAAPPEAFFVTGSEGPLKEGELDRAAAWGKGLA